LQTEAAEAWMGGMAGLSRRRRDGFEVGVCWLRESQEWRE
jgi:hypothetical protein